MQWRLTLRKKVRKQISRIPERDKIRILEALVDMEMDPFAGDTSKLEGTPPAWRRRIGDWRIVFDVKKDRRVVEILWIRRRGSKTY